MRDPRVSAPTAAAFAITIGAAGSALGRFLSGWMSDHMGRLLTVRLVLVASFLAAPALYFFRESVPAFYVLLFIVYYAYGTQLSVYTALAGDFYGPKHSAANYGILLLAWGTAGIFGPLIGGRVFTATGNYQVAFFLASGAALASLLLLTIAKPPTEEQLHRCRQAAERRPDARDGSRIAATLTTTEIKMAGPPHGGPAILVSGA